MRRARHGLLCCATAWLQRCVWLERGVLETDSSGHAVLALNADALCWHPVLPLCAASSADASVAPAFNINPPTLPKTQEEAFLKRYIEYCRQSCSPRITDSAAKLLANEYVELRAEVSNASDASDSAKNQPPVAVTPAWQIELNPHQHAPLKRTPCRAGACGVDLQPVHLRLLLPWPGMPDTVAGHWCPTACSLAFHSLPERLPCHLFQPQSKRAASADGSDIPAIPVTVRQLEAVIRIAESLAKMNLQVGCHIRFSFSYNAGSFVIG